MSLSLLIQHAVIYFAARVISALVYFVTIALYTRWLSPEDYGHYALVWAGVVLFNTVFYYWLGAVLLRYYPLYQNRPQQLLSTLATAFVGVSLLVGMLGGLFFLLSPPGSPWRHFIPLGIGLLWFHSWGELNLMFSRSQLRPFEYTVLATVKSLTALLVGSFLIIGGQWGATGALMGLLVGSLLTGLMSRTGRWIFTMGRIDPSLLKESLSYGLPLTVSSLFLFLLSWSDRFLIASLIDTASAGVYSAVYDFINQSNTTLMMYFNLASYPIIVRILEEHGVASAAKQMQSNMVLLLILGLPITVGVGLLAPNIFLLFGADFRGEAIRLAPWLAVGTLLFGIRTYHFDLIFHLKRNTLGYMGIIIASALVKVGLSFWWIPSFGLLGSALSTLIAGLFALIGSVYLGQKLISIPFPYQEVGKILLATGGFGLVLQALSAWEGLPALMIQISVGGLVYGGCLWFLNILGCREKLARKLKGRQVPL